MSTFKIRSDGFWDPKGNYLNPLTNQPYSKSYTQLSMGTKGWAISLKAYQDKEKIIRQIHNNKILIVSLPTGVGKTVVIPKLLLHYFGYEQKIIVTTPRQTTTAIAGEWAAACLDVPLFQLDDKGKTITDVKGNKYPTNNKLVGYKHGKEKQNYFDKKQTKLLFTTDGTVKAMITGDDPQLKEYGGIIIDEVHERSLDIDTVISLVMNILKTRPNFKIIFMSATMDTSIFESYFKRIGYGNDYSIYSLPENEQNTTYPILPIFEQKKGPNNSETLINLAYTKVLEIMEKIDNSKDPKDKTGNILIFLASDNDINKLRIKINKNMSTFREDNRPYVYKISGNADKIEIDNATKETMPPGFARKIIIATPMAESSITFEGELKYVIDTGIAYTTSYDAKRYCFVDGKNYTTQANIGQRCGRTGRTCPGTCIQLYTQNQLHNFNKFTNPKILEEDFTSNLLNLLKLKENDNNIIKTLNFVKNMIEPYYNFKEYVRVAVNNIIEMDFIDSNGDLSKLGLLCSDDFDTFDFKIAKMIICGSFFNCIHYTIVLGAILNNIKNLNDIFIELSYVDQKDKLKVDNYNKIINNLIYNESDHITLLNIVNAYLNSSNQGSFARTNYLNEKILELIKQDCIKLTELIQKKTSTKKYKLEEFSKLHQFNNISKVTMSGGFKLNKNLVYNKNESRINYKKDIYNSKTKYNLFTKNNTYVGGFNIKSTNSRKTYKSTNLTYKRRFNTTRHTNSKLKTILLNKNKNKKTKYKTKYNLKMMKGGNRYTNPIDKVNAGRRYKYMELFTLANFKNRNKSAPVKPIKTSDDLIERIIACLYYGYSTNIACYSGINKDYYVKFSTVKGTLFNIQPKTSSFDYKPPKTIPDFVLYNKFAITKNFGVEKPTGNLQLVTKIDPIKHLSYFFDLQELKKKVIMNIN